MAGAVTKDFRLYNAERLFEEFSEAASKNMYLFIARSVPWGDDNSPPTPQDSNEETRYRLWDYILGFKKISSSDVSFGAINNLWASGTVYTQYTSNTAYQMSGATQTKYYVITDDFNVYKCLYNNGGAASTVNPSGQLTSTFTTGDGYIWKFMFPVTSGRALKFQTTNFFPVETLVADDGGVQWDVQAAAANGAIDTIFPVAGGSGYLNHVSTLVSATSNTAVLGITANSTNGSYVNYSIYLTGGTGSGQLKKISGYNASTRRISILGTFSPTPDATTTYVVSPTVTITGDGVNAKAYATVNASKQVSKYNVITAGQSYSYATAAVTANSSSGSGATAKPQIAPPGGHGSDPVRELAAHNIILNTKLTGSESNTFTTQNDWRQIGIIVDPLFRANSSVATGSLYNNMTKLAVTGITGTFVRDELVTGGTSGASGYLVEYTTANTLSFTGVRGSFSASETITGGSSGAHATVTTITLPTLKKYTGRILYVENKGPVSRSSDQVEDYKIVIKY